MGPLDQSADRFGRVHAQIVRDNHTLIAHLASQDAPQPGLRVTGRKCIDFGIYHVSDHQGIQLRRQLLERL